MKLSPIRLRNLSPTSLLLLSYSAVILIGAVLLYLPWATVSGQIPFIDALFTSTSAVCVTGLIVVDTGSFFSSAGQAIILTLIQIGGLGIMTITVVLVRLIGLRTPLKQRLALQDVFSHSPRRDLFSLIKSVVVFTAAAEAIGAIALFLFFSRHFPLGRAAYIAVFHAVSAFCNAGFSLFRDSLINYQTSPLLNGTVCVLITLGGLGFPVIHELFFAYKNRKNGRTRFSLQTKTVLVASAVLTFGGAIAFLLIEVLGNRLPITSGSAWLIALFQSVTARTAGFNTVDIAALGDAALALLIFLMFFGASPGSCGGGIKTTALAVLTGQAVSRFRGRTRVSLYRRTLPVETVNKTISLFILSMTLIAVVLFCLLIFNDTAPNAWRPDRAFLTYLFETVSAFGTVGLSMGVTPHLNPESKTIIILLMFIGRLGVPAFSYILLGGEPSKGAHFAEEKIMVG